MTTLADRDAALLRFALDLKAEEYRRVLYVEHGLDLYWPDLGIKLLKRNMEDCKQWYAARTDEWGRFNEDV